MFSGRLPISRCPRSRGSRKQRLMPLLLLFREPNNTRPCLLEVSVIFPGDCKEGRCGEKRGRGMGSSSPGLRPLEASCPLLACHVALQGPVDTWLSLYNEEGAEQGGTSGQGLPPSCSLFSSFSWVETVAPWVEGGAMGSHKCGPRTGPTDFPLCEERRSEGQNGTNDHQTRCLAW